MKSKTLIFFLCIISFAATAQSPEAFTYQFVVRNTSGQIIADQNVSLRISILSGSTSGNSIYTETHTTLTNQIGLVSLMIGRGSTTCDFLSINWGNDTYFIQVEIDINGENNYVLMGASQLLSVPFALYSKTSGNTLSSDFNNLINVPTNLDTNYTDDFSGNYFDLTNKPSFKDSIAIPVYTNSEIHTINPYTGQEIFNSSENLYQIYTGVTWVSIPALCWPQPTIADAGEDQVITDNNISTMLDANSPETYHGNGFWSIVSGEEGNFADPSDPSTVFTGQLQSTYKLCWSISTICDTTYDFVNITFANDGPGNTLTDIDGNDYNTVWIGNQLWMAENLRTTRYADGTLLTNGEGISGMSSDDQRKYYFWYNNDSLNNAELYGALYTWGAILNGYNTSSSNPSGIQGICPAGWHIPSDDEWKELEIYLGLTQTEADASGWRGTNQGARLKIGGDSGFEGILSGEFITFSNPFFRDLGSVAKYWTASENFDFNYWCRILNSDMTTIGRGYGQGGFSVRCVKD